MGQEVGAAATMLQAACSRQAARGRQGADRDRRPGRRRRDPRATEWVLLTESPEGGWGIAGHANTQADIAAAARAVFSGAD